MTNPTMENARNGEHLDTELQHTIIPEAVAGVGLPLTVQILAYASHKDAQFEVEQARIAETHDMRYDVSPATRTDATTSPYLGTGPLLLLAAVGIGTANLVKGPNSISRRALRATGNAIQDAWYAAEEMGVWIGGAVRDYLQN